eukprot:928886-Rhodomonas_salina.2
MCVRVRVRAEQQVTSEQRLDPPDDSSLQRTRRDCARAAQPRRRQDAERQGRNGTGDGAARESHRCVRQEARGVQQGRHAETARRTAAVARNRPSAARAMRGSEMRRLDCVAAETAGCGGCTS